MGLLVAIIGACAGLLLIYYVIISIMKGRPPEMSSVLQYILYLAVLDGTGNPPWVLH